LTLGNLISLVSLLALNTIQEWGSFSYGPLRVYT